MTTENETKPTTTVAVIGAAGKMGRRVSDNLVKSDF
ncbi:oxidoreductase, partial [Streptomyces cavourensis]